MLLETLDIKTNDIIIYSLNSEKLENNFKIIFKNDPQKKIRKITFVDVCKFINDFSPKNLIVYRLLTNIPEFQLTNPRYGLKMFIDDSPEIMFLDPVMAIKELNEYPDAINYYDLRFRIQQVGLTTKNSNGELPNYAEIYKVDLEADEAANQNDKTFVEALFVGETVNKIKGSTLEQISEDATPANSSKTKSVNPKTSEGNENKKVTSLNKENNTQASIREFGQSETKRRMHLVSSENFEDEKPIAIPPKIVNHKLAEDKDFDSRSIQKVNISAEKSIIKKADQKHEQVKKLNHSNDDIKKPQKLHQGSKGSFSAFLEKKQKEEHLKNSAASKDNPKQLVEIFKSPSSLNKFLQNRDDKPIVLKLKGKNK